MLQLTCACPAPLPPKVVWSNCCSWTYGEPEWHAQTAHRMAHTRSAQSIAERMRLTASSYVRPCRPVRRRNAVSGVYAGLQSSRLRLIRDVRLSHERVGQSITSIRARGLEQCRLRACALHLAPNRFCVAIDVLMPFHSITTTDSVGSINGGLAKSPSEVLNPPCSSLKAAGRRV